MNLALRCALFAALMISAPPLAAGEGSQKAALPPLSPGSNEVLRAPLSAAPQLEVIVSDVIIPPGGQVPRHYHPGEEFLYLIEGAAVHVEEGRPDRPLKPGEGLRIPPRAVHAPRAGPEGARAIVFRVHVKGEPERIPVPAEPARR